VKNIKFWDVVNCDALECLNDLAIFLNKEFSQDGADKAWSQEYFNWKLGNKNPAGKGYVSYATSDDKIVGTATLTKKRAIYNSQELVVGEVGDTYTLSDIIRNGKPTSLSNLNSNPNSYVNRSVFGRLISEITHRASIDGVSIIYGTPNKNSFAGYTKRLKFLNYKQYKNTINYRPSTQLLIKKYSILKPLSKIFFTLEVLLFTLQRAAYGLLYGKGIEASVGVPDSDETNILWKTIQPETGFSLVRDYEYWLHRYISHPLAKYRFINLRKNGSLVALVVVRELICSQGRRVASIVEWMSCKQISIGYLLSETLSHIYKRETDYYYYYSSATDSMSLLSRGNFFFYNKEAPIIFLKNSLSEEICKNNKSFEFHLGSSDAA